MDAIQDLNANQEEQKGLGLFQKFTPTQKSQTPT